MKLDTPRLTFLLCCLAMMCLAVAVNLPPVYLTTFGEAFGGSQGLSEEQLGRIPAVLFVTMVVGIPIFGPLADRWGARLFAVAGLGFIVSGLAFLAGSGHYWTLLAAMGLLGLGVSSLEVVLSPIVAAARPVERAFALNRLHSFYSIGAVVTVLVGSAALYFQIPWRAVCLALCVPPLLVALGFAAVHPPSLIHENETRTSIRVLIRRPYLLAAALAICLGGAAEIGIAQWLPAYAERGLGYSKAAGGTALAAFSVAMAAGRWGASHVACRMGTIPLMASSSAACTVLYLAACFIPSAPIALAAGVCVGFSVACLWPSSLALAADRYPNGGASMFALMAASGNVGCTAAPWLIGVVAQYSSMKWGIVAAAVCPAALLLLLLWMAKSETNGRRI